MKKELAIEFGSENLRIFEKGVGIIFDEPNVVLCKNIDGIKNPSSFGRKAIGNDGKLAENEEIIFPIVSGKIVDSNAQVQVLQYALKKSGYEFNLYKKMRVLICISCGSQTEEIEEFKKIIDIVGIKECYFVFQPICIAQTTNIPINQPQFIIDIGHGKTEIAVVSNNEILKGIRLDIGGKMFNIGVKEILKVDKNLLVSNTALEKIKVNIGSLYSTDTASIKVWAQNLTTLTTNMYTIYAKDINIAYIDCHNIIIELIQSFLADLSPELVAQINQNGIIISGESSKLFGVKKYYENKLKIKVKLSNLGGTAVVEGAKQLLKDFNNNSKCIFR